MKKLIVKNIGPIKEAKLELRKVNVLIGTQSTGKSTLAKIACYCNWVEKEIFSDFSAEEFEVAGYFEFNLVHFHKMQGFVSKHSEIEYETDVMYFKFSNRKFKFKWKDLRKFKRFKTLYIPAERNIVAVIPNWFEVNLERNNTRSFLADWESVRKVFTKNKPLQLLENSAYYYDANSKSDYLKFNNDVKLSLGNVSSGFQTLTPLLALFHYYSELLFVDNLWSKEFTLKSIKKINKQLNLFIGSIQGRESIDDAIKTFIDDVVNKIRSLENLIDDNYFKEENMHKVVDAVNEINTPQATAFYIEEPELNLYPKTQRLLINQMIESVNKQEHTLFITTHSPYVLTTLNNLIYAAQIGEKHRDKVNEIIPESRWIKKEDVAAWKIEENTSEIYSLIDEELKMIKAEDIDDVSAIINEEFDQLFDLE